MDGCFRGKTKYNFLWWALISATFTFCTLLIYYIIIHKDFTCLTQSSCLTAEDPRTENLQAEKCRKVCKTKDCLKFSSRILSNMDPSTEPCDDFYQFVCGKYREKYEGAGNYSTIRSMLGNFYSALKVMIDTSKWPEESAMNKVKVVFESCMNPGSSDVRSIQDLLDFLDLTGIPEWPRLDENFAFLKTPLYEILGKLISFEQYVFFRVYGSFQDDFSTGSLRNLTFSPGIIRTVPEKLTSDLGRKALMTILLHLGLDTELSQEMTDVFISIETERMELMNNASEANCTEEKLVLNCIEENSPNMIMLCNLIESIIRNAMVEALYDKDRLEMSCDEYHYAEGLHSIIEKYSDRDIANYIALIVFFNNVKDLDFSLRMKLQTFFNSDIYDDFSANLDRQKKCIYWLASNMHYPLGVMYIDSFFPKAASQQVDDLIRKFANATAELVLQQSWLGHSKYEVAKGISSLDNSLKYRTEDMKNITEINATFEMFKPTKSSFISNSLMHQKNRFTQMLTSQERIRFFIQDGSFDVNAYGGSDIHLTFGVLTLPLFHHGHPDLFNYAGIGHIIGHEIGHFFFRQFESHRVNVTNQTRDSFVEKAKCLIDQYSSFKLRKIGKNLQGNATVSENIPDSLGVKTMEIVSENYMENVINENIILPGLPYSAEQLLYIAMGQTWCDAHDAGKENYFYSEDSHSPPEYRVVGTLQNSPRFSEVFRCSKSSYMNAKKKCITFE